jgi:hypothetical protein
MKSVVVIDQKSIRGTAMLTAFSKFAEICSILHTHEDDSSQWRTIKGSYLQPPEVHPSSLVVLRHFRDQDYLKDIGDFSSTVYYGGNGANDRDAPNQRHFAIQRPINSSDDSLTNTEAHELVVFLGDIVGRPETEWPESADWPTVIRPSQFLEYSASLSLLCQGYLAQYALNNRTKRGVNLRGQVELGCALKIMGWVEDDAAEIVSRTMIDLDVDYGQPTPGIAFWTDPFEGCKSLRDGMRSELPKSKSKLLESVDDLVKAIEENDVSTESFVLIVAKAYLTLSKLLEAA